MDNSKLNWQSQLTDEMTLETVQGALDELFMLARRYKKSENFKELLEFVASFKRYSAFNAMLVHIQMPGAKYVLPASRWHKEYRRRPKVDAQPLVMLKPMGPVMFGYDVSQTEGKPLPRGFDNPFEATGRIALEEFNTTLSNAKRDGVVVKTKPLGSTLGGYVRNAAKPDHLYAIHMKTGGEWLLVGDKEVPVVAEITLNSNLPDETNYATITHELGHLYCGHVGTPNPRWWPDRRKLDKNAREFEAESVSYLVCCRAGLDTPAVEYLHGYLNSNDEVPQISLDIVFKAAQHIETMRTKTIKIRSIKDENK